MRLVGRAQFARGGSPPHTGRAAELRRVSAHLAAAARPRPKASSLCQRQVRAFLDVGDAECCCFQNVPERRSVPQVAHAHVFLRARRPETAAAVAQARAERRLRSPWAEAERLGGRGEEVGF